MIQNHFSKKLKRSLETIQITSSLLKVKGLEAQIKQLLDFSTNLERSMGPRTTVKVMKEVYTESIRFACGLNIKPMTSVWLKRDRSHFVRSLSTFKHNLSHGTVMEKRMSLSLLRAFEFIKLPAIPDLESVTADSKGSSGFLSFQKSYEGFLLNSKFVERVRKSFKQNVVDMQMEDTDPGLHFTLKSGPYGTTMGTAAFQTTKVPQNISDDLISINNYLGRRWFGPAMGHNRTYFDIVKKDIVPHKIVEGKYEGRIAFIPDKGGKTRLVAIGNYWIQDTFLQVHKIMYKVLKGLPSDGTYNQNEAWEKVKEASRVGPVWSYDLTAATDRFPLIIQEVTLNSLIPGIGPQWGRILRNMDFIYEEKFVKYKVGQPMGLYSSWASFTVCHHLLVQYCAWTQRREYPFNKYSILGDDVAIWDEQVAIKYSTLIKSLDVAISPLKSFIPENLEGPCVAEFAKRISDKGEELSALSPNMIASGTSFWGIPSIIFWLNGHGFISETLPFSEVLQFVSQLRGKPLYKNQVKNLAFLFHVINIMGRETLVSLTPSDVSDDLKQISGRFLLLMRIKLLMIQADKLKSSDLNDYLEAALRSGDLDPDLHKEVIENHYFNLVLKQRFKATRQQVFLLSDVIERVYEQEEELSDVPTLSELEYVPFTDFKSILKGFKPNSMEKKTMRWKYIHDLTETLLKINSYTKRGVPLKDIENSLLVMVQKTLASAYMRF